MRKLAIVAKHYGKCQKSRKRWNSSSFKHLCALLLWHNVISLSSHSNEPPSSSRYIYKCAEVQHCILNMTLLHNSYVKVSIRRMYDSATASCQSRCQSDARMTHGKSQQRDSYVACYYTCDIIHVSLHVLLAITAQSRLSKHVYL